MASLSKEAILKHAGSYETRTVPVPAWRDEHGNEDVILRSMTIKEFEIHQARLAREQAAADGKESGEAAARLLARCVVDESGRRVFTDDDAPMISNLGLAEVLKLTEAVNELSGIGDTPEKQAEIDKAAAGESDAQTSSSS